MQNFEVLIDMHTEKYLTRILRPSEFEALLLGAEEITRSENQKLINSLRLRVALVTGMRYSELREFAKHPEWYNRKDNYILIPREKKHGRGVKRRYVRLPDIAREIIPTFLSLKCGFPAQAPFITALKRWAEAGGIKPDYITTKTFRKTWESWLVVSYPDKKEEIALSQGHKKTTMLEHYLNIPFTEEDKQKMRYWVRGWG